VEHVAARSSHPFLHRAQLARRVMNEAHRIRFPSSFSRDLFLFICAVLVGTSAAIGSQVVLSVLASPPVAANASLAFGTTCSGAAHARLVHRKPMRDLLPAMVAGAPAAYGVMRMLHLIIGV
jgi:hypothetical protein